MDGWMDGWIEVKRKNNKKKIFHENDFYFKSYDCPVLFKI